MQVIIAMDSVTRDPFAGQSFKIPAGFIRLEAINSHRVSLEPRDTKYLSDMNYAWSMTGFTTIYGDTRGNFSIDLWNLQDHTTNA